MAEVPHPLDVLIIGFYYPPEPIGIAPYTAGLARGLIERGHTVRAIVGYPHYPQWKVAEGYRGLRRREVIDGVDVVRVRHPVPADSAALGRVAMEVVYGAHAATVRGRRPDVVVAVSPALFSVAAALTWRKPGRTAVGAIVQDVYSRALVETGALNGRGARAVARLEGAMLSRADGVAVIHDIFRDSLTGIGVDPQRVRTIRNWSHTSKPTGDTSDTRRRLGWGAEEIVALHTGNMGHKQGLENLVEAARLADASGLPVRFVLMGDGSRRRAVEAAGAGVQRLQVLDPLPAGEFENALAAADVLVLNEKPGIAEMCVPGKLTSYFAAGRPVIAATDPRSGAAAEIRASGAGVCVESGHPRQLLDAVVRMSGDHEAADELGRHGQDYARRVLAQDAAVGAYVDWVEGLAPSRTPGVAPEIVRR